MKNVLSLAVLFVSVSACTYSENGCMVGHYCLVPFDGGSAKASDWTPTANATGPVEVVAAKCDMLAHGTVPPEGGFYAAGSQAFVSGAMAGATLQQGMKQMGYVQNVIRDCMTMNGFQRNPS
jgi:hypothetical protein